MTILFLVLGFLVGDFVGALTGFSIFAAIGKFFKTLEAKALTRKNIAANTKAGVAAGPAPRLPIPFGTSGATGVASPAGVTGVTGPGPTGLGPGQVPGPFGHPIP
jgi:hypothetical protein